MADVHPGDNGDKLKHYWLYGEGRAKWSTWTELYHHLVKYLNPETAKRVTEAVVQGSHGHGVDLMPTA
jgi:hypothetical protein